MRLKDFADAVAYAALRGGVENFSIKVESDIFRAVFISSFGAEYSTWFHAEDACNDDVWDELECVARQVQN